jgi:hypothetical protein
LLLTPTFIENEALPFIETAKARKSRGSWVSNQPANTIAEAATQFGQEDDITVLTVTRTVDLNPMLA